MTTIQGGIPLASAREITPQLHQLHDLKETDPERWESMQRTLQTLHEGPSAAERAAQLAKQRAVPVHSVYRVNGEIVAIHQTGGGTTSTNAAGGARNIPGQGDAATVGWERGLRGDALNDFVADHITANLKKKYGSALTIETYDNAASAPTTGEMQDEMFGITSQRDTVPGRMSRVAIDTESWARLLDQYR
ncbi:hypothetical protein HBA54_00950 [Pelagibius litoralis]|uniref:Uncharacterized protein n=1 Tax=Pelagibius litoralis TaxID=374515 RepID=A0A967C2W6_9PROT|nr:hypothetical protein [Pelagibius litoralis]NIA67155.1 hypothetical protein [Pelagibius litoralis]